MRFWCAFLLAIALFAQDPEDAQGWIMRGVEAFRAGNYSDAAAAFERAVRMDPASVQAHIYLGTAYLQQYIPGSRNPENQAYADAAAREFERVIPLDPQNTLAIRSIATLRMRQKNWDEAQQWFEKAIGLDSTIAEDHYCLGFIAWSRWYPAYSEARAKFGMQPETPGPFPDGPVKQDLKSRFAPVIEAGMISLGRAIELNADYTDAMAYMNLLVREWADTKATKAEYDADIALANQWVVQASPTKRRLALDAQQPPAAEPDIQISEASAQESLVRQARPAYPPLARQARIQGTVRLYVIFDSSGTVVYARALSGHPLLIPSALEIVKQWQYDPVRFGTGFKYAATQASITYSLGQ